MKEGYHVGVVDDSDSEALTNTLVDYTGRCSEAVLHAHTLING